MGLCSIFGLMAELLPVLQHQECLTLQPNKLEELVFLGIPTPHQATTCRHGVMVYISLRMQMSHFMLLWREVPCTTETDFNKSNCASPWFVKEHNINKD